MRLRRSLPYAPLVPLLCLFLSHPAQGASITQTGLFTADNQVVQIPFNVPTSTGYLFYTDSYGGGRNLDGTMASAGGFVPILTLFSSTTGNVLGTGGGTGTCSGPSRIDPSTRLCEDAYFTSVLTPGNYVLTLTEFPNVATGTLTSVPEFLFANDPAATGTVCGVTGGTLLQADTAPCTKRTGAYAVNAASVPEPGTLCYALPALGLFILRRRRLRLSRS